MSAITTSAPARASVSASARPSPRAPPVMRATRPERSISIKRAEAETRALSFARHEQFARDHEPLDLRGALVDLVQLRVAHQLLDRVLLHVPVAAENLHGIDGHLHADVRREALRIARLQRRPLTLVDQPGGLPAEEAGGLDLRRHVRD